MQQTYQHIISRLTETQKIRLLTDFHSLADPEMHILDMPHVDSAHIQASEDGSFITPSVLARTWNTSLVSEMSRILCLDLAQDGVRHVILPSARACIGDSATSLSEDPHLSAAVAGAYLVGANAAGVPACMDGYGYKVKSKKKKQEQPERVVNEHLLKPFKDALSCAPCTGLVVDAGMDIPASLKSENSTLLTFRVCKTDKDTISAIANGELCISGNAFALQKALHTFRRLRSAIAHGKSTTLELEDAIARGDAVSEVAVNDALEKLIGFAFYCAESKIAVQAECSKNDEQAKMQNSEQESEENKAQDECSEKSELEEAVTSNEAIAETQEDSTLTVVQKALKASMVLLENKNGFLPLKAPRRICVIGEAVNECGENIEKLCELFDERKDLFVGYARGYALDEHRSPALIDEAEALAAKADVILLFLSTDALARKDALPANQIELCRRLCSMYGKRIAVVVSSEHAPDVGFFRSFTYRPKAILLAPLGVKGGAVAAVELMIGKFAPEGRLTKMIVDSKAPKSDRTGYKRGPFVGYRYYDTVGDCALYPFGHGLSYTRFEYSDLYVENGEVVFRITNIGKRAGVEVAQVYLGINESACLRPKKELVGFERVELDKGESRLVRIPLGDIPVYDKESDKMCSEKGVHTVYLGASAEDIRLTCLVNHGSEQIQTDGEHPCDYLPTVTNIFKEHYTLEADCKPMKFSLRNLIFGVVAVVLSVLIKLYDFISMSNSLVLNIAAAVLALCAIVVFIIDLYERKHYFVKTRKQVALANAKLFEEADEISVPSADALFADPDVEDDPEDIEEEEQQTEFDEHDLYADVDKSLTFARATDDLVLLAKEKGIVLDKKTAIGIFASFATSRLMLVRGMSDEHFSVLVSLLCEYFGCPTGIDAVDESYQSETDVLFGHTQDMIDKTLRNAFTAINAARGDARGIHIVPMTNVVFADMSKYFAPFAKYARSPLVANTMIIKDEEHRNITFNIPQNVWFMLNIKDGESIADIPDYIAEISTVNNWRIDTVESEPMEVSEFAHFRYGQMIYLCDKAKNSNDVTEAMWKKIDELEAFAAKYSDFHITNKMSLGFETYLSILLGVGFEEESVAMDNTVAAGLLPSMICALAGKISRDERGLGETLDYIFGDDHTAACRRMIKNSGANII